MPALGVGQADGTLVNWLKQPGDAVAAGEPVVEIETDKSTMDLESPVDGWLGRQLVEVGSVVAIGTVLGEIREAGDDAATATEETGLSEPTTSDSAPVDAGKSYSQVAAPVPTTDEGQRRPHALSPRQRRLLQDAAGSAALNAPAEGPAWLRGRHRGVIGRRVAEAWTTIPHFAVVRDIAARELVEALTLVRAATPDATLTDLLLLALGRALRDHGVDEPVPLGLAVATPDGVVVPIIEDTTGAVAVVAARRRDAVARARTGRLSALDAELRPVATLSNLGAYGVDQFTGIIGGGQIALLTVGRIAPRPIVSAEGAVVVAEMFTATLNVDHRQIDGDIAARILASFAHACESIDDGGAA